jgi:hypothetical protein
MADALPRMSLFKRSLVLFAFGLLVGLMGANAVADAAGLRAREQDDTVLRVLCGFILGLATIAVVIVGGHFGSLLIAGLRQSPRRPNQTMAMTLVICGAVCLLAALVFEWYVVTSSQVISPEIGGGRGGTAHVKLPSLGTGELNATVTVDGSGRVHIGKAASPIAHVIALGSFAAGAVLIAIGVWSSMSAKPEGYVGEMKPSAGVPANLPASAL